MSTWVIVALAALGLALLIVVIVLLVRYRRHRAPQAPKPTPLPSLWAQFLRGLPVSARGDPVVVVLGERLSGKSRLVEAGFVRAGRPALASPNAPDDGRLSLWAGRGMLVQELSSELLEDARPEAREALQALWEPLALQAPLVVIALDTHSPSWTAGGLQRLGALARDRIDLLTALRGSPPSVRVCLSHLDESAEGFADLATIARDTGHAAALMPLGRAAAQLAATLAPLEAALAPSLATLPADDFGRLTRFLTGSGPRLLGALEPFLGALLDARTGAPPPALDGIVLSALPEGGTGGMLGDPLLLDTAALDRDARTLDGRRRRWAVVVGAIAAALLLGLYGWNYRALDRAARAVRSFRAAAEVAKKAPQRTWTSNGHAREAEGAAADALEAALDPLWPPLHAAFPDGKEDLADLFLQQIRELYLFPAARGPDRVRRIRALSLLYASRDNELGKHVSDDAEAWAADLEVPARVVRDYLQRSEHPWPGTVTPPPDELGVVTLDQWQSFFEDVDAKLQRVKISRDELEDLKRRGKVLSDAVQGALEVRGLSEVIGLLEAARRPEMGAFLGRTSALDSAPRWVSDNWETIDGVLAMVQQSSADVPPVQGKGLVEAVADLDAIARVQGDRTSDSVYELVVGDRKIAYPAATWAALIRGSRGAIYLRVFADDVRTAGRPLFFASGVEYAAVGLSTPPRGPRTALPGMFTARAVEARVRPPLLALDATLDAASVPREDREAFTRFVREETARYGAGYRAALSAYVQSFQLDTISTSSLHADLEDMVGPASWFTDFWATTAANANIDAGDNAYMSVLSDALRRFQTIVPLQPDAKGKSPLLDKYYALIAPFVPSLDAGAPAPAMAAGTPLADRLPPIGKLGLAVLDQTKPAPLVQVAAWLDDTKIVDRSFRRPFLAPVELAYELALRTVERTLAEVYSGQVRPLVAPSLGRFPLDPRSDVDASPADLLVVVGPKGTFRTAIEDLLAPVCQRTGARGCVPRAPAGFRAVVLPADAIELADWSASLSTLLWDDGGKPRPIVLQARPRMLPEVKRGAQTAVTLSFLRSGTTTVYGFNQKPAWHALPVAWWTADTAGIGVELTERGGGDQPPQAYEAEGDSFRFYRLLCRGPRMVHGVLTWPFEPPIAFEIQPDPWALVVPPQNRARRCVSPVARY